MTDRIDILIATYNGGRYLEQQIDSVLAQSITNWRLIIRDDCSTDNTREIIGHYLAKYPDKFVLLDNGGLRLGSCQNFTSLLQYSTSEYIMFCDQDDVWLPHKIAVTFEKLREMEASFGKETPLMVYTDLKVVDENLEALANSFWQMLHLNPENGNKLNRLVLQNVSNGCAMMINKPLRDRALPIPVKAMMHDWWLTLVVATFGRSAYLPEPTVLYRQHGMNVCGAGSWDLVRVVSDFCNSQKRKEITTRRNSVLANLQKQAEVFLERYESSLTVKTKRMLKDFLEITRQGFFMRRYLIVKNGFLYGNMMDNIGMLLFR
jgi:glycosyltransferase involved in cell wall biosynthesis